MSDSAKIAFMPHGVDALRDNELMRGFIDKTFDYDQEVAELEREIISIPAKMEITFNYIHLSFQLFPSTSDETFTLVARYLDDLHRYYDKVMYLDKSFKCFDNSRSNEMDTAQTGSIASISPQSSLMEVDTQSRLDWL